MPRSSGGGSSRSGGHSSSSSSHSSSSSSSHSSSSSSSRSSSSSSGHSSSSSSSDSYSRSGNSGSANIFESNYFEGARCFVYYRERKPVFIYSKDDPHEMGKAKIVFIVIGLSLIIAGFSSFDKGLSEYGFGIMCFMVGSMFLVVSGSVSRFGPKELTEIKFSKANPKTEACPYCGYTIASNVHETCPHCESKLELKPFVEDEQKAQQTNLSAKGFAEVNSDINNPPAETLIQQNPSIAETSLENNANCDDGLIPDAAESNESRETNRQIRKNITNQSDYDRKWYAFYEKNKMYLLCANDDLSIKYSDPKLETRIKKIIAAAVLLIAAWATTLDKRETAVNRVYGYQGNSVIVEDNADVLDDKQEKK